MQGSDNSGYGTYPTPDGGTGGNGDGFGFGDEVWGEQALMEFFMALLVLYFILWVCWLLYNLFLRSNGRGEEQTRPGYPDYGEQSGEERRLLSITYPGESGEGSDREGAHGGPGEGHFYDVRDSDESDREGPDGPEGPLSGVNTMRHRGGGRDGRGQ